MLHERCSTVGYLLLGFQQPGGFVDRLNIALCVFDSQYRLKDPPKKSIVGISQQAREQEWLQRVLNDGRYINKG